MTTKRIPARADVNPADTWDLGTLFASDAEWESALIEWQKLVGGYAKFQGTLGQSPQQILELLGFDATVERLGDRVGTYAFLKEAEDVGSATAQGMKSRMLGVASQAAEASSFYRPELLALPAATLQGFMNDPLLAGYRVWLERLVRFQPHTLSQAEERLLAMQTEISQTPRTVFDQLTDADLKFGLIQVNDEETVELSHGMYAVLLEKPDRDLREIAFRQYYAEFTDHANTLAATLAGSVKQDVYQARVRNFASARAAALFPDNVPESVYENLVTAVRANLPAVHKYYDLRKRAMKLEELHFYDIYTPILNDVPKVTPWADGVEQVIAALAPLGSDYTKTLAEGLRGRWCDRYENKGKHSGAFSSGCYDSAPYILMNYQDDVLDHVFTLAHEAGHSMHTLYSKAQPYQYANYTIFVAEVASTFNEQLLSHYLLTNAKTDRERAYLLNREIDATRRTIIRQTMFAEFETIIHTAAEKNEPLTLQMMTSSYGELLQAYFGPNFVLDAELNLECLRIPHFYRAFYVYKYATGLAAAIALSERVRTGGAAELADYLNFLKSGSAKDPLDLLRTAGVDMATPTPVDAALKRFGQLVDELDGLLK